MIFSDMGIQSFMSANKEITTRSGLKLKVQKTQTNGQIEVSVQTEGTKNCLLHWGVRNESGGWQMPPRSSWPQETKPTARGAAESAFARQDGENWLVIRLDKPSNYSSIDFVLFFPEENRWDNNGGQNYRINISGSGSRTHSVAPSEAVQRETGGQPASFQRVYELAGIGQLAASVYRADNRYHVILIANAPGSLHLYWGLAQHSPSEWLVPSGSLIPAGTSVYENSAETPFQPRQDGLSEVRLEFPEQDAPVGVAFVLKQAESGRWVKDGGSNFFVPLAVASRQPAALDQNIAGLADEIIRSEMSRNSWTLMHRFNLCHDLLDRVRGNAEGLALLFVWLRFSVLRQLDWQRNYNTQPRELSHSQDRLTLKLTEFYNNDRSNRGLIRLMLATLGRGGEGQKIRDEILAIMHRHHVKEVSGHFMEEWHQKLHNNTTPDDVVICEAYLAFLRSNGNRESFYKVLESGGVTKARLESFERPIRTDPDFVPHLKDGLIHDFENFLRTLKAIHSGTDFETAINAANYALNDGLRGLVLHLYHHQNDPQALLLELAAGATDARRQLDSQLARNKGTRELLYLDLALEQFLRTLVERSIHLQLNGDQLVEIAVRLLQNLIFSDPNPEFAVCLSEWEQLAWSARFSQEWSLRAKAVLDRIERSLGTFIDRYQSRLQPKAEYLGNAFHAAPWTISIFSEEVIRGTLAATLSMVVRNLQPVLRQTAHLGDWQVVSRGSAMGQVEVIDALRAVQGNRFQKPTVLIAGDVGGEEEIPENVTAVITSRQTDVLSHVAVRARDAKVLFATCYSQEPIEQLKSLRGRFLSLDVNAAGDLTFHEVSERKQAPAPHRESAKRAKARPHFFAYAIPASEFNDEVVGGKSSNQTRLNGKLPDWVHQPSSVALPFGVFEEVLALDINRAVRERYDALTQSIGDGVTDVLSDLRQSILDLGAPEELIVTLRKVMENAGLPWPDSWDAAWTCIKRVWASKWNERAYLSRRARGIAHEDLFMAVLIQQVIEAEYAFVIHTVNPLTGSADELYAEMVLGLGETLVGNYPGRALSFVCEKKTGQSRITAFPSKSAGLYGGGLIFRSDSNGEDLPGYAGAGLYDSVMLNPPQEVSLDYSQDRLLRDETFRNDALMSVAKVGLAIEESLGSAQDIEGVYAKDRYYVVQTRAQTV